MITAQNVSWYWHRLRAMDGSEIVGRIAQKGRALGDRKSRAELENFCLGPVSLEGTRPLPDATLATHTLREGVAAKAAAIRNGHWRLFGWKEVQMSDPPQWGWDAVHECLAPLDEPVATLDHRQLESGADPRSVWEVNRWAEIVVLAQNAWLNGAVEDAELAQRWLQDWIEKNAIGQGINWTSALEAGLRLINFTWIDQLLRSCSDSDIRARQDRLAATLVPGHAWWIWRHRSFGSSANNHLLGELAGLILAARRWPSLIGIACSAEKAWQQMQDQVMIQFDPDGGNREQALHYHLFAWEMVWQSQRAMGGGRAEVFERMGQAAGYFAELAHPDEPWDFGDSDDAEITPLTLDRSLAWSEWQGWFKQLPAGESLAFWLGHPPEIEECEPREWRLFPGSGQAVKRAGQWMARFDASPLGFGKMAAHGHLDALHVSLWLGKKAVLIDPGTGAYYSDPFWRAGLADWDMHNGPVPETGRHGPERMGPFLWARHHEPPRLRMEDGDAVACLACDGPFVKREVHLSDGVMEVRDSVCNSLSHQITWILAPEWTAASFGDSRFRLTHSDGQRLMLDFEGPGILGVECFEVGVSPHFLERKMSHAIRLRFTQALKTKICSWV